MRHVMGLQQAPPSVCLAENSVDDFTLFRSSGPRTSTYGLEEGHKPARWPERNDRGKIRVRNISPRLQLNVAASHDLHSVLRSAFATTTPSTSITVFDASTTARLAFSFRLVVL